MSTSTTQKPTIRRIVGMVVGIVIIGLGIALFKQSHLCLLYTSGTTFYVYLPVLEQQQEREQLQWGVDSKLRILAAVSYTHLRSGDLRER